MNRCKCGSYAINHRSHGRDGSDGDLCDVCYWRKRAEAASKDAERYRWLRNREGFGAETTDKAIDDAMIVAAERDQ